MQQSIIRLWNLNVPTKQIAASLSTTPGTVSSQINRLRNAGIDLPARRAPNGSAPGSAKPRRPAKIAKPSHPRRGEPGWLPTALQQNIIQLWADEHDVKAIATTLNTSPASIQTQVSRLRKAGIPLPEREAKRGGSKTTQLGRRRRNLELIHLGGATSVNLNSRKQLIAAGLAHHTPTGDLELTAEGLRQMTAPIRHNRNAATLRVGELTRRYAARLHKPDEPLFDRLWRDADHLIFMLMSSLRPALAGRNVPTDARLQTSAAVALLRETLSHITGWSVAAQTVPEAALLTASRNIVALCADPDSDTTALADADDALRRAVLAYPDPRHLPGAAITS